MGIIGIVAAMTLPSVIVNYQKQEALTRLKKSYTTVANALVTAVSEHGDVDTWNWDEPESIIKNYLAPNWTGIEIYNGDCRYGTCYCMNKDPNRNQPAVGKYGSYDWPGGQGITSPMPSRVPSVLFMDGSCVIFGKYFEQKAKLKTTDAVVKLMDLSPKTARVKRGDKETVINADSLNAGDIVILKAGESAPCDGKVISGNAFFDESALSGESRLVKKEKGSNVFTASILSQGYIELEATAVGADTTFSKIIALIDEATTKKAPIARIADKVAAYFVPFVIIAALITFVAWLLLGASFALALTFAVSVLVVSCPCALGLATPTAIMAGTGKAASYGVLFKSPDAIEILHKADTVIFDKTGTLTYGKMAVRFIKSQDKALESINLMMAKSLEEKSDHPLAKAIVAKADVLGLISFPVTAYKLNDGLGVEGLIGDDHYYLGGTRYLSYLNIEVSDEDNNAIAAYEKDGFTVLCLIKEKSLLCL